MEFIGLTRFFSLEIVQNEYLVMCLVNHIKSYSNMLSKLNIASFILSIKSTPNKLIIFFKQRTFSKYMVEECNRNIK